MSEAERLCRTCEFAMVDPSMFPCGACFGEDSRPKWQAAAGPVAVPDKPMPAGCPAGHVMTWRAGINSYAAFKAAGWTDEQLLQHGYMADARASADAVPPAPFDLVDHLNRQAAFSAKTFGPGARVKGVTDHIRKELVEVCQSGGALAEWVDVIILAFDGAWRSGATPHEVIAAIVAKQTKNEARTWPDWRTAPADKAIEHDRTGEAPAGPRVYLSGPMTGIPDSNFPAFNAEADCLRALGYDVVNPVDINPDPTTPWQECLRADLIALLNGCTMLALLPGWEGSAGAHLEMQVAHRVGITITTCDKLTGRLA